MQTTGLKFKWISGSLNDNGIRLFKKLDIPFRYSHTFQLEADFYRTGFFQKVEYRHLADDVWGIVLA